MKPIDALANNSLPSGRLRSENILELEKGGSDFPPSSDGGKSTFFGKRCLTGNRAGPIAVIVFASPRWLFKRFAYSVPSAVIGLLLGGTAEDSLIYSYQISPGQWSSLLERPVAIAILLLRLGSLFGGPLVGALRQKLKA